MTIKAVIAIEGGSVRGSLTDTWSREGVRALAGRQPTGCVEPIVVEERDGKLWALATMARSSADIPEVSGGSLSFSSRGPQDQPVDVGAWPLASVLSKLIGAAEHLHRDHNCDAHGWEGVRSAVAAGREHLKTLESMVYPPMTPETLAEIVRGAIAQGRREALTEVATQLDLDAAGALRSVARARTAVSREFHRARVKTYQSVAEFCRWRIKE
jgi:hypothetical protein